MEPKTKLAALRLIGDIMVKPDSFADKVRILNFRDTGEQSVVITVELKGNIYTLAKQLEKEIGQSGTQET